MKHLIRYAEIGIKGSNRHIFERKLVENIKRYLRLLNIKGRVERIQGRIILDCNKLVDLKKVFGIHSYSIVQEIVSDIEDIKKAAQILIKGKEFKTFRISSHRADKSFPLTSLEINKTVAESIWPLIKNPKVDLKNPEYELFIEVLPDQTFLYNNITYCFAGLPYGTQGRIAAIINNENDLLAALLVMKRGCIMFPFSDRDTDISILKKYACGKPVILRKLDILDSYSRENGIGALVVGQTIGEIRPIDTNLIVLRPLVGFTESRIKSRLEEFR